MDSKKIFARRYEIILSLTFILLLGSMVVVGYLASTRFNAITDSLLESRSVRYPRAEVERIRSLMSESELAVKAFTLTKNEQFLDEFYNNSFDVIDAFEALEADTARYPERVNAAIDSLHTLVFKRMDLFGVILESGDEFRVAKAMNEVNAAVESVREKEMKRDRSGEGESSSEVDEEEIKGFLGIFKRKRTKERTDSLASDADPDASAEDAIETIDANLANISSKQKMRESEIRRVLLQLSLDGEKVNEEIDKISSLLATLELQAQEEQAQEVAALSKASSEAVNIGLVLLVVLVAVFMAMILLLVRSTRRYSRATRLASERAVELANSKENFVANVSHELRTPLNAIIGYVDMLDKQVDDSEKGRSRRRIRHAAQHLHGLINDLLDWTKLEAGGFQIVVRSFRLSEVMAQVEDIIHAKSAEKGVELKVQREVDHDVFQGDPVRLKQVMINLLGNAFKFTDQGHVELRVQGAQGDDGLFLVTFEVSDTGVGIPTSEQFRVFEVFEQSEFATTKNSEGSGLGLPISKRLVEMMGGEMSLESEPGKGTTVRFILPLVPNSEESETEKVPNVPDLSGKKVLLVDDNPFNVEVLASYMQDTGAQLIKANSADEALIKLQEEAVDIAILDIRMPDKDGFELARMIPEGSRSSMRMIALTALDPSGIQELADDVGFNAILPKPIDKGRLYEALRSEGASSRQQTSNGRPQEMTEGNAAVLNQVTLRQTFGDEEGFMHQMLHDLVDQLETEVPRIIDAIEEDDRDALDDLLHKNLPACRQVGAEELVKNMTELRDTIKNAPSQAALAKYIPSLEQNFKRLKGRVQQVVEG